MQKFIFLIIFLFSSNVFPQEKNVESNYYATFFKDGLPSPMKFDWPNAKYAQIEAGDFYKNIYIVFADKSQIPKSGHIVFVKIEGGFSMSGFGFCEVDSNFYTAQKLVKTYDEDILDDLNIIFLPSSNLILYRWGNKIEIESPKIVKEYPLKIGKIFPALSVETKEASIDLGKNRNKVIVLNWWATTCLPCIEEMPGLNSLVEKYRDEDVLFISILWDKQNLEKFKKRYEFNYVYGFSNEQINNLFGESFPRNIVLDKSGIIAYNESGGLKDTYKTLDKIISDLLIN